MSKILFLFHLLKHHERLTPRNSRVMEVFLIRPLGGGCRCDACPVGLSAAGRIQEAEKDFDQALNFYKQLAADFPNQPDLRSRLACTGVNRALLHQQQGDWAAAKRLLPESRPHHLAALKANPRHPTYRECYRNHGKKKLRVRPRFLALYSGRDRGQTWVSGKPWTTWYRRVAP